MERENRSHNFVVRRRTIVVDLKIPIICGSRRDPIVFLHLRIRDRYMLGFTASSNPLKAGIGICYHVYELDVVLPAQAGKEARELVARAQAFDHYLFVRPKHGSDRPLDLRPAVLARLELHPDGLDTQEMDARASLDHAAYVGLAGALGTDQEVEEARHVGGELQDG